MIGRREFGLTGLSAVALAAFEGSVFAQAPQAGGRITWNTMPCFRLVPRRVPIVSVRATCARRIVPTSFMPGTKEHMTTLATCQDCADFCAAASQIVSRGGPFAAEICKACAEACAMCAKECEKFPDDEHMKMCAVECRKCEKACREMVGHAGHAK